MVESRDALLGPVQFITVLLHEPTWEGRIADQLVALEEGGIITIIDAAMVVRESEEDYQLVDIDTEIVPGRKLLGTLVGGLLGLGMAGKEGAMEGAIAGAAEGIELVDSEELFEELADAMPIGGVAAVVAMEQTWARGLMGAIRDSGGEILGDEIIHAEDLIDLGYDVGTLLYGE